MRSFFVTWMERLMGVLVILSALGVGGGVWHAATRGQPDALWRAAAVALGGFVGLILTFGLAYLLLAIHDNTRRTALAAEAMLRSGAAAEARPGRGVLGPVEGEAAGLPPRRRPVVVGPAAR